jgi:cytochrome c-type biogenesis protein
MAGDSLNFGVAFLAGLASFLSPCVLPLVPPYLSYLTGATLDELTGGDGGEAAAANRDVVRRAVITAVLFVLGFSTVFIIMGSAATAIGQLFRQYIDVLAQVAGVLIIIMGLHFLGLFRIGFLLMERRVQVEAKPATRIGAYVMGLAFALGWTPCIGPVLSAILGIAASEESVSRGAFLLGVYSAGLGVPFVLAAFAMRPFLGFMRRFRRYLGLVEKAMGVFLIITGIMFITGGMQYVATWLLEIMPSWILDLT